MSLGSNEEPHGLSTMPLFPVITEQGQLAAALSFGDYVTGDVLLFSANGVGRWVEMRDVQGSEPASRDEVGPNAGPVVALRAERCGEIPCLIAVHRPPADAPE